MIFWGTLKKKKNEREELQVNRDRLNFLIRENSVEPPAKRVKIPLGKCAIIIKKKREKIALLHSLKPSEIARFFSLSLFLFIFNERYKGKKLLFFRSYNTSSFIPRVCWCNNVILLVDVNHYLLGWCTILNCGYVNSIYAKDWEY